MDRVSRNVVGRCSCLASLSRWRIYWSSVVFASVSTALRPRKHCGWMAWIVGGLRSARIEDCVGRGGCHDRSLNVASVTGPAMLLILKDLVQTPRSWIGIQQWNLILISKCHKCHSLIFQIRPISRVPILIAQWYPIDLSIPYLASVHHDYEVSRFITVPLTTLSFFDNFGFIGYVCLRWVIELLEGGVEVGIDLRVSVMSSMGMVLV